MYNKIIKKIDLNKISTIIFDFDYTLTTHDSNSSIGVFSNYLPSSYYNRKKFLDFLTNIAMTSTFYKFVWRKKLKLLHKYYNQEILNIIDFKKEFKPNKVIISLLKYAVKSNMDVVIYSSGIEEIIKKFLNINNIDSKNIKIISNKINNTDFIKIITPKKEKLNYDANTSILLIGDKIEDLKVVKNAMKILISDEKILEV